MKTKCTPETTKQIAENIQLGMSNKDAARLAGIGERTFYDWLSRAQRENDRVAEAPGRRFRKSERPFMQFSQAIKKSQVERKKLLLSRIQMAAQGGENITETRIIYDTAGNETGRTVITKTIAPNWTAAAWLLERLHNDEFGRRHAIDITDWRQSLPDGIDADEIERQFLALLTIAATQTDDQDGSE